LVLLAWQRGPVAAGGATAAQKGRIVTVAEPQIALDGLSDSEFRARMRAWLEEYYPQEWRQTIVLRLRGEREKRWHRLCFDHGWRLPAWPKEHGGMGLSAAKQLIYQAEMDAFGTARVYDAGGVFLGPVLMSFGTPEQLRKYLPEIARGDVLWAQGYSEPNAGSDLASLKTTAVRDGDHYVINGSKIWTTMIAESARIFLLARTSQEARKQEGISFFLLNLDSPGVSFRPIMNLSGEDEFGQVFFDNVRVPAENRVGAEGDGWTVAKSLLGTERISTGSPGLSRHAFNIFERLVNELDLGEDPVVQDLHARLVCDLADFTALYGQIADASVRSSAGSEDYSILKILSSELFQRISEANLQVAGELAGATGPVAIGAQLVQLNKIYMIARASSIYGGANDVQRDIIARTIVGKSA
jgi:alkylation response protein AidB-like acyl-CoA dehydrogenase